MGAVLRWTLAAWIPMALGCGRDEPLPDDLYEEGWDRVSPATRVEVLRADLERSLDELDYVVGARRERLIRVAGRQLSALRPELVILEGGEDEYRELERRFEQQSGDAP
jgi:hypothetical protein